MRTSAMKTLKVNGSFCGTKSMLLSQWRSFVFVCFSQYISLYISFTLVSTTKFPKTNNTLKVCLRAWSFHWIVATSFGIKFCIICSSSAGLFGPLFVGLSASSAVERSIYLTCYFDTLIYIFHREYLSWYIVVVYQS